MPLLGDGRTCLTTVGMSASSQKRSPSEAPIGHAEKQEPTHSGYSDDLTLTSVIGFVSGRSGPYPAMSEINQSRVLFTSTLQLSGFHGAAAGF